MRKRQHIALLLAGGKGTRMHQNCPKQFIEVAGQPILLHTMLAFDKHPDIDAIYVVCDDQWQDYLQEHVTQAGIRKFVCRFSSGHTSMESLYMGLKGLLAAGVGADDIILTHDSVRPLVSAEVISNNLATCMAHGNAITGIQSHEAYMISSNGITSEGLIPRDQLFRAQTPQTFLMKDLVHVMEQIPRDTFIQAQSLYTLMAAYSKQTLYIAPGDDMNFKMTWPHDIEILEALLQWRSKHP